MALSALEPFVAGLQAERGSAHSTQKQLLSSSFSDYSSIRKLLTCLNFHDFSLQPLNNPLNLQAYGMIVVPIELMSLLEYQ